MLFAGPICDGGGMRSGWLPRPRAGEQFGFERFSSEPICGGKVREPRRLRKAEELRAAQPSRSCSALALQLAGDGRVAVWTRTLFAGPICDGGGSRRAGGLGNWGAPTGGPEDGRQAGCRLAAGHLGLIDREVPSPRRVDLERVGGRVVIPRALELERGRLRQRFGGRWPSTWRARP